MISAGSLVCLVFFLVCVNYCVCDTSVSTTWLKLTPPTTLATPELFVEDLRGNKGPPSVICGDKICLRKCCQGTNMVMMNATLDSGTCVRKSQTNLTVSFPNATIYTEELIPTKKVIKNTFQFIKGYNTVLKAGILHETNFYLIEDGSVVTETPHVYDRLRRYKSDRFCINHVISFSGEVGERVFILHTTIEEPERNAIVAAVGMAVSSVFLAATLLVYNAVPRLRNLHGKVIMAYATSLLSFFITQSYLIHGTRSWIMCNIVGLPSYYSILATFFWMNIMAFDVWYKFRSTIASHPVNRRGENHKFCMYCLYGFGCPLVMTIITGVLNYLPTKYIDNRIITPGIGDKGCFLQEKETLFYLYIPMGVLLTANLCLFVATSLNIYSLERDTRMISRTNSHTGFKKSQREKNKFMVYVKIFTLMGVLWVFQIVSSVNSRLKLWYLTDALNGFIGVYIFFIFVGKKKIRSLVFKVRIKGEEQPPHGKRVRHRRRSSSCNTTDQSDEETCSKDLSIRPSPM